MSFNATPRSLVVVQNNFVQRLTGPLAVAARERGIALHDVSSGDMSGVPAMPPGGPWSPVLVVGSVLFVNKWARGDADLSRWVFWNDEEYDAARWAEMLGGDYLKAGGYPTTVGQFTRSDAGAMHIRPRSGTKMIGTVRPTEHQVGEKSVSGMVVTPDELRALQVDPGTAIWASAPCRIHAEVRNWMIGGRLTAASTYRVNAEPLYRADHPLVAQAAPVATRLHSIWHPDRHYVVDLALTDEGWRVIEYNPIHSSGWYAADPDAVLVAFMEHEGS